ncbi:MAG: glycosyl transferase [Acetatifactor sp.]|nr:glycosyl transferase [Acetatifactor sp.]
MIFVVLGTQKFQLNRLLKQLDEEMEAGMISEEVFAQIGHSDYEPKHYAFEHFLNQETFEQAIQRADLIIAHSGVGTIMTALNAHKPVLVYPRQAKYKEHVDNHQMDIATAFAKKDYVLCYDETKSLADCIAECRTKKFAEYVSCRSNIVEQIRGFIASCQKS